MYAISMPNTIISPWAKFTRPVVPKMSESPMAARPRKSPSLMPSTMSWATRLNVMASALIVSSRPVVRPKMARPVCCPSSILTVAGFGRSLAEGHSVGQRRNVELEEVGARPGHCEFELAVCIGDPFSDDRAILSGHDHSGSPGRYALASLRVFVTEPRDDCLTFGERGRPWGRRKVATRPVTRTSRCSSLLCRGPGTAESGACDRVLIGGQHIEITTAMRELLRRTA